MAVELRALARNVFLGHERVQVTPQFLAGVSRHAPANSHRKMIAAGERPDVSLKLAQELDGNSLGLGGNEIAERHFQIAARKRLGLGQQGIARPGGDDDEIRLDARLSNGQPGALPFGIDLIHARANYVASGIFGTFEQQAVQHGP